MEIYGDDSEADVTQEQMKEMKYLEACIKEALRLFPSVPIFARYASQILIIGFRTVIFNLWYAYHSVVHQSLSCVRPTRKPTTILRAKIISSDSVISFEL